jgi:hypothetical protein
LRAAFSSLSSRYLVVSDDVVSVLGDRSGTIERAVVACGFRLWMWLARGLDGARR